MQLLVAVFNAGASAVGSVASGIGSALSGLTGAGATAAGKVVGETVGVTSKFTSLLQGGLGLVSAMGELRAGQAQADALRSQAADTRLNITQEGIAGTERQDSLRRQLVSAIGERDTAYAASGVDLSFGTPVSARRQAIADADRAIVTDQNNVNLRQTQYRSRALSLEQMAADAASAGGIKALGSIFDTAIDITARG